MENNLDSGGNVTPELSTHILPWDREYSIVEELRKDPFTGVVEIYPELPPEVFSGGY